MWKGFLLLPFLLFEASRVAAATLVFTHAAVIDVKSGRCERERTVVIDGNRVAAIGKTGKVPIPANALIVDASGKFLIPGLWDMHAHTLTDRRYEYAFPLLVANGITGVREMGSNLAIETVNEIRRDVASGKLAGPRFGALTYRILDGPGTQLGTAVAVGTPADGRRFVREYKESGADFIKPYNQLSRDVYLAIVDEARRQHIPLEGHVPFSMTAAEVSDLGQRTFEHNFGVIHSCSTEGAALLEETRAKGVPWVQTEARAALTYDARLAAGLFRRLARNGTWSCPTLSFQKLALLDEDQRAAIAARYIPPTQVATWRTGYERLQRNLPAEARPARYAVLRRIVVEMHRAGVGILAGTDTGAFFAVPGFSLHDELEELVKAGLTPLDALRSATLNPAIFLHQEKESGTVAKGKFADLLLLDANPLDDISNTRRIAAVVLNGRLFDRKTLDAMLAAVEAAAHKGD